MKAHPMSDARERYTPPAIYRRAFNCPRCGVLAAQQWFEIGAREIADQVPRDLKNNYSEIAAEYGDMEQSHIYHLWIKKVRDEKLFLLDPELDPKFKLDTFDGTVVYGIWFSQCFHCKDFAIWIEEGLVWPLQRGAPLPNSDLPDDVRSDYEEASSILNLSPRGAAALLRLGIQKLCRHLGGEGNISDDVSSFVKSGLRVDIQQALDAIRVIGNNAVHPGQLDLQDDHATARSLFDLVNFIASAMISEPKRVSEIYESLPEGAREAIKRRDAQ